MQGKPFAPLFDMGLQAGLTRRVWNLITGISDEQVGLTHGVDVAVIISDFDPHHIVLRQQLK